MICLQRETEATKPTILSARVDSAEEVSHDEHDDRSTISNVRTLLSSSSKVSPPENQWRLNPIFRLFQKVPRVEVKASRSIDLPPVQSHSNSSLTSLSNFHPRGHVVSTLHPFKTSATTRVARVVRTKSLSKSSTVNKLGGILQPVLFCPRPELCDTVSGPPSAKGIRRRSSLPFMNVAAYTLRHTANLPADRREVPELGKAERRALEVMRVGRIEGWRRKVPREGQIFVEMNQSSSRVNGIKASKREGSPILHGASEQEKSGVLSTKDVISGVSVVGTNQSSFPTSLQICKVSPETEDNPFACLIPFQEETVESRSPGVALGEIANAQSPADVFEISRGSRQSMCVSIHIAPTPKSSSFARTLYTPPPTPAPSGPLPAIRLPHQTRANQFHQRAKERKKNSLDLIGGQEVVTRHRRVPTVDSRTKSDSDSDPEEAENIVFVPEATEHNRQLSSKFRLLPQSLRHHSFRSSGEQAAVLENFPPDNFA